MLAQNFKLAADLGISEPQREALMKTLVLLETGKLTYAPHSPKMVPRTAPYTGHFNMSGWAREGECGTVRCIGGTASIIGAVHFEVPRPQALENLFYPPAPILIDKITVDQAATALRSYLTTGDAKWHEAVA